MLSQGNDDKKVRNIVRKLGVQPLNGMDEVNFFRDDNTVLHFQRPEGGCVVTQCWPRSRATPS